MEFCGSDNLSELFHVCGLDINDVEALVLYVKIPEIYPEIITADEGLAIAIHRNAIDVVCMRVCVRLSGNGGNNSVVVCQSRQEVHSGSDLLSRCLDIGCHGVCLGGCAVQGLIYYHLAKEHS